MIAGGFPIVAAGAQENAALLHVGVLGDVGQHVIVPVAVDQDESLVTPERASETRMSSMTLIRVPALMLTVPGKPGMPSCSCEHENVMGASRNRS
ncbi:hypothetical protein SAMN04487819_109247 [Actinopolyspora alba]|uniref:Uncharacterized protein n=1 Tax=Actinopolyspora alba TaxID=673379 RepID=A0A1I1YTU4_9ACTN|nr:hypothetical protein SAMN04487819_109247 [Actinopolyspora alba]